MIDLINQMTADLQKQIKAFKAQSGVSSVGTVLDAGDGIARVDGLSDIRSQEWVLFENGTMGTAFYQEKNAVGVNILGDYGDINEGMQVRSTGRISSVPVGDGLIGWVVNVVGEPIDGKGSLTYEQYRPLERAKKLLEEGQPLDTDVYLKNEAALRRSNLRVEAVQQYRKRGQSSRPPGMGQAK